ncbi:hypothetical protein [Actinoplanes couchii]|nr:hypothetical protein [Actinoplanes couchii]MDR6325851.1 hypothetical protein [Actinoplanes couchii]
MGITLVVFFALVLIASFAGLTKDSHDSADWKPSREGRRAA